MNLELSLGAFYLGEGRCRFRLWAPQANRVEVRLLSPTERQVSLKPRERGYFEGIIEDVEPGTRYLFRLNGSLERPDPASRYQPEGVHCPSQVVDPSFPWTDEAWRGLALKDYIIYELHVGTFTDRGTFDAALEHLDSLRELGVTALELMPVAQFPGDRNWGYDGAYPFAVQNSYGGPEGLKRLVDACHQRGMAIVLDVVYNHLGPEGNYLADFGPYFTDRYRSPWGDAINFDGPGSDEVRRFFIESALSWFREYHVDALRLDALHGIFDFSAKTFLEELTQRVHELSEHLGRPLYLMAESDLNDPRLIRPPEQGGVGLDAHWNDDFHHALHTLLTGEQGGYYKDFGRIEHLVKAFREGFVYTGQYSSYRMRSHGAPSADIPAHRWIVFSQNHDQVGNRLRAERLSQLVDFEALKLAASVVLLSPFIPLLFMGEEYGETSPFPYFISHSDEALIEAVREGRKRDFASFQWSGELMDPQDETTYLKAKLSHQMRFESHHKVLWNFYRELIRLRKSLSPLSKLSKDHMDAEGDEEKKLVWVRRWAEAEEVCCLFHFGKRPAKANIPLPPGLWRKLLDSTDEHWLGPGTHVPPTLASRGSADLTLLPNCFILLVRKD